MVKGYNQDYLLSGYVDKYISEITNLPYTFGTWYLITAQIIMAKTPINHSKPVTPAVVKQVEQLAKQNTPTRVIGLK